MSDEAIRFFTLLIVGTLFILMGIGLIVQGYENRKVVSRERAVIIRKGRAEPVIVALDRSKDIAVSALVRDGWKRSAAVSALASGGWAGYPDPDQMVLAAWQSMPSRMKGTP